MADNLLRRTLVALADANVRFVVCGGVACVLQGVARTTHDLDVRVALEAPDLEALSRVARALERRRAWVDEKHAVVYTLIAPRGAFSLDVFLRYPLSFDELAAEADAFDVEDLEELLRGPR